MAQTAPGNSTNPAHHGFDRTSAYRLYQALLGDRSIQTVISATGIDTLVVVASGPLTSLPPSVLVTQPPVGDDADPKAWRNTQWLIRDKAIAVLPAVSSLKTLRQLLPHSRARVGLDVKRPLLALADPDFVGSGQVPGVFPGRDPYDVGSELPRPADGGRTFERSVRAGDAESDGRAENQVLDRLPPLYATRLEGLELAHLLGADNKDVLLGPNASKQALLQRASDGSLERTSVLAFSTHALVSGDFTGLTEPALVLARRPDAGPEHGGDEELLRASEAAALKLNADWVVLSACNTASGETPGAEGLSGLARAFFYAGAQSLLVSNWRVSDQATERLITDTFRRYKQAHSSDGPGLSKATALQGAMLAMIDDPDTGLANPTLWAPFVIVGEPQ
jgi:CHAT domain-containing protein